MDVQSQAGYPADQYGPLTTYELTFLARIEHFNRQQLLQLLINGRRSVFKLLELVEKIKTIANQDPLA
jgi:hypothetical protein